LYIEPRRGEAAELVRPVGQQTACGRESATRGICSFVFLLRGKIRKQKQATLIKNSGVGSAWPVMEPLVESRFAAGTSRWLGRSFVNPEVVLFEDFEKLPAVVVLLARSGGIIGGLTPPRSPRLIRVAIPERAFCVKSSWRHSILVASLSGQVECFNGRLVVVGLRCGCRGLLAGCLQPSFLMGCIPIHPFVIPSA
jgi:hypothetical protein